MKETIFSRIAKKEIDPEFTVVEDTLTFAQISLHQKAKNRGHVLVIPKRIVKDIYELPEELDAPLMSAIRLVSRAVKRAFQAEGIQIRQNCEAAAGQDIFHLHFHVIPRFGGDDFEKSNYEEVSKEDRMNQAKSLKKEISIELQNT